MSERLETLKRHPYGVSYGGRDLGILSEIPEIRIAHRRRDYRRYDRDGGDEAVSEIVEVTAKIAVGCCDIATALELAAAFAVGDDVIAPERARELVLAPPAGSGEKSLRFPRAVLLPELDYSPRPDNHRAKLTFMALPDADGTLYVFA